MADIIATNKQRYKIATYEGLLGMAFSTGKIINIPNVQTERLYFQAVAETKSELVVPIKSVGSVIGIINSESEEIAAYDNQICSDIEQIALALGELLPIYGWSSTETPFLQKIELLPSANNDGEKP